MDSFHKGIFFFFAPFFGFHVGLQSAPPPQQQKTFLRHEKNFSILL